MLRSIVALCIVTAVGWWPFMTTEVRSEQMVKVDQADEAYKDQIAAIHNSFWKSFADRDLWTIGQMWDQSDTSISAIFPAAATPAIGWDNVAESFRRAFSHNRDIRTDTRIIRTYRTGDLAWLISTVKFEAVQTQTGQPVLISRMFSTEIFALRDGAWKLVHYHGHNPEFAPPIEGPENMNVNVTVPKRAASAVWAAYDRFGAAFQQKDLAQMFEVLDSDGEASALQPTSPVPFLGIENVLASWKKTFVDIESFSFDPQVLELSESGSTAWVTDLSQFHIVFKDNPNEVRHFHNVMTTLIFRKHGDEWRLAHYHAHLGFSFDDHNH
jgi:ketosteroid isomerase-like protein